MRKILISAALLGVVASAAPASAQYYGRYDNRGGQQIDRQIDQIVERIDRLYQRRLISSNEARRLRDQANDVSRRLDRYSRNGLDQREYQDLQYRIQNLRQRVQEERREGRDDRRDRRW